MSTRAGWSFLPTRHPNHVVLEGESGCRGPRRNIELGEDVAHVTSDRPLADEQLRRDIPVRLALRHQSQDFSFPCGQSRREPRLRASECVQPSQIRLGAELVEDSAGALELSFRPLLVSQLAVDESHEYTQACRFVRHVKLLPG